MRVVVTGGGTSGHITPIKPVIEVLRNDSSLKAKILFIGQKGDPFVRLINEPDEVNLKKQIFSGKYRRYPNESTLKRFFDVQTHALNLRDIFLIGFGTIQSIFILRKFKADVVFGKGGYVSVPVGFAARILRIPLVIHESDALPGLANRLLAKYATSIALGMPTKTTVFESSKTVFTGIPLRSEFLQKNTDSKKSLKQKLELDDKRPLLVVTGGSLGAEAINTAVIKSLPKLLETLQIVHITGENKIKAVQKQADEFLDEPHYHVVPYSEQINELFRASDMVISRASATFFNELAMLGVTSVLIPAKQLLDQQHNAKLAAQKDAAVVLYEKDMEANPDLLASTIMSTLKNQKRVKDMQTNIKHFANPEAARSVASLIINAAGAQQR